MDNERPNERTLWSSRLEEPGALPGTGLTDKEAAWDKLYDRLRESEEAPRRKRMIWLWTAAACLLLIVVPAALLLKEGHKATHPRPKQNPVATSPGNRHTSPAPDLSPHSVTPSMVATPLRPARREGSEKGLPHTPARPPASGSPSHRPDLNKLLARDTDTLNLVFAPRPDLSKPMNVTAAAPPKKEQRVVHINELDPPQPTPSMVKGQRYKPGSLRIELNSEGSLRPSTTYAGPEAHPILTFKHAQNP